MLCVEREGECKCKGYYLILFSKICREGSKSEKNVMLENTRMFKPFVFFWKAMITIEYKYTCEEGNKKDVLCYKLRDIKISALVCMKILIWKAMVTIDYMIYLHRWEGSNKKIDHGICLKI